MEVLSLHSGPRPGNYVNHSGDARWRPPTLDCHYTDTATSGQPAPNEGRRVWPTTVQPAKRRRRAASADAADAKSRRHRVTAIDACFHPEAHIERTVGVRSQSHSIGDSLRRIRPPNDLEAHLTTARHQLVHLAHDLISHSRGIECNFSKMQICKVTLR